MDYVGRAVALKGNHLVIGAPTSLDNVNGPEPGSVYIYERDSVDWVLIERVFAPDSHPDDFFGNSVALNTERIVAGAIGNDADGMNAGSAYVFSDAIATHVPPGVEFGEILAQNYPNPFNPSTTVAYSLDEDNQVKLVIYDVTGAHLRTLVERFQKKGNHRVLWDGRDDNGVPVASGVYFYRLKMDGFVATRRMVLVR